MDTTRLGIPVLLVATATKWAAPAYLPRELARAGFDVYLLAPTNALVARSRHVARIFELPDASTPLEWARALLAAIAARPPRLVIPCDDTAVQLMMSFVEAPPEQLDPLGRVGAAALLKQSLGDPRHYRSSIDKSELPFAAAALGVRVPASAVVTDSSTTRTFALAHGYPVVLKRAFGAAGSGVRVARDEAELQLAVGELLATPDAMLWRSARLLVQAWVPGKGLLHAVASWQGVWCAGMSREVLLRNPATGPSATVRCRYVPEARRTAELLTTGFGISGLFGIEFIEHEATGELYLIEINRRITNGHHLGGFVGVDLCDALAAAVEGRAFGGRTDLSEGEEHFIAEFPQEWLRDPNSEHLRNFRSNVPWDDVELLRAMLALRRDD